MTDGYAPLFIREADSGEQLLGGNVRSLSPRLPAIVAGLTITLKHLRKLVSGKTKVTMQYPEERWDSQLPPWFRGAPALVKDEHGKERCVACQLCEFICPPRAITIVPEEIPSSDPWAKVEKRPKEFEIVCALGDVRGPGVRDPVDRGVRVGRRR